MANGFGSQYWDQRMRSTPRMDFNNRTRFRSASSDAGMVGAAAGLSTLPETNKAVKEGSPDWGKIGEESIMARSKMHRAAWEVDASVKGKELWSEGQLEAAELWANAREEAAGAATGQAFLNAGLQTALKFGIGAVAASDRTIKNNIESIEDALAKLRELKPVSFYYNEEYTSMPERIHYGFIAQEYKEVMPDATYFDEDFGKYGIDTAELIGLLVRAVQQLETKVTRLEAAHALEGAKR